MSAPHAEQIVAGYLAQLELALAALPAGRRADILAEIRQHIADARAKSLDETDSDVYNVLERLGDPSDIAAAARPDAEPVAHVATGASRSGTWIDIAAVVLVPILWPVGVILLWMSSAWSARDKLIGTLVPPGGYVGTFVGMSVLLYLGSAAGGVCSSGTDSLGEATTSCSGIMALPAAAQFFMYAAELLVFVLWLVLPVLTGIYLGVRLRRRMTVGHAGVGNFVAVQSR